MSRELLEQRAIEYAEKEGLKDILVVIEAYIAGYDSRYEEVYDLMEESERKDKFIGELIIENNKLKELLNKHDNTKLN